MTKKRIPLYGGFYGQETNKSTKSAGKRTILRQHIIATRTLLQHVAIKCRRNIVHLAHYIATRFSNLFPYIYGYSLLKFIQVMRLRVMLQMLLVMWWRNFSRFDLVPEYKVLGSGIRRSFQRIKSLPFVPVESAWLCPYWLTEMIQHSRRLAHGIQILGTVYQSYSLVLPWRPKTGARTHCPEDCWPAVADGTWTQSEEMDVYSYWNWNVAIKCVSQYSVVAIKCGNQSAISLLATFTQLQSPKKFHTLKCLIFRLKLWIWLLN